MSFKFKPWLFYLVVFTLPMYTKINNVLLVLYVVIDLIELVLKKERHKNFKYLVSGWPIMAFFGLSLLAAFRSFDTQVFKLLENHWSLLFIPIVMLTNKKEYTQRRHGIFLALSVGTIVTLLICNVNHVMEMLSENIAFRSWFNGEYFGQHFTAIADSQPAYLSLFVVTSILFLIQNEKISTAPKFVLLTVLLVGLFQLTSKIALVLFLLFLLYMVSYNLKIRKQQSIGLISGVFLFAIIIFMFGAKYMKGQMFFVDSLLDEKRIERWEVSYEIFREHPFIGVGYQEIESIRNEKYVRGNYSLAAANDLNAHNQFLEYLSIDGAVGGFVYAVALGFLFLLSVEKRDHLFTLVFFAFFLANLTESMMVRIKGIEYFAIFGTLFLCAIKENHGRAKSAILKPI